MLREFIREEDHNCKQTLKNIFMRENITKIMHGCDSDIKYLVADLEIVTYNLFDTARAFSFIQRLPPFDNIKNETINISKHVNMLSLEKLMKMFIDLDLDKYY